MLEGICGDMEGIVAAGVRTETRVFDVITDGRSEGAPEGVLEGPSDGISEGIWDTIGTWFPEDFSDS